MPQHMVGSVLFGADDYVAEFVRQRIPQLRGGAFGPFTALGIWRHNRLIGGVVYHHYIGFDIQVSIAFDRADWALPSTLRTLFYYPFVEIGCVRMTAITARNNKRSRRLLEGDGKRRGLGFKLEGIGRKAFDGVQDAACYSLLRDECRFLRKIDGQANTYAAAGT
jgi:RimJ/RimL family protein N-acetyltransferase